MESTEGTKKLAGEPDNAEQLKAQTVEFTTFDELKDNVTEDSMDIEQFMQ